MAGVPVLPLRDIVVFPQMVVPLFVGRAVSVAALEQAMAGDRKLLLVAQKTASINNPGKKDVFPVGTIGHVIQVLRLENNNVKVLIEGRSRARILEYDQTKSYFTATVELVEDEKDDPVELKALARSVQASFENYVKLNKRIPTEMVSSIRSIENPSRLADTMVAHIALKLKDKQKLLENKSPTKRLMRLQELMQTEIEILQVEKKIRSRVKKQMEKTQKEYYLNEQMQAIQKELGDKSEFTSELAELEARVEAKAMSKEAKERCGKELKKLKMMNPMSAEASVIRTHLDWILDLPWSDCKPDQQDLSEAEKILDRDHFGLDKVKERIVEYLAVKTLVGEMRGPILCLVGPPGVGKTSLARSVAKATGRDFARLSLGGVRDEAEIRGHRRTYIGALPGKLLQSLKKAGSNNPVLLLDEIDKMTQDFRGDPSAALLEVLDPEQNSTFRDHYLDLDYDVSQVLFITTANNRHEIPLPLQDRLEILDLSGYTRWEKLAIAKQYLVPKQHKANGLSDIEVDCKEEALLAIIQHYTKEAGVRNLEQKIATCFRKIAKDWLVTGKEPDRRYSIDANSLEEYLGSPVFIDRGTSEVSEIGLANGLAVTVYGGDLLPSEVAVIPGKGKLTLTGKLGDVMKESAQAAMSYVRSRADSFGLPRDFQNQIDVHVHFPEGAIPKDGPSAGITMVTSLVSALLRVPVRTDVAMTGEVTLRGRVLPVGGIKQKLLAAHRAKVTTVVIPEANKKDIKDVPEHVREALTIRCVKHMDEVLQWTLAGGQDSYDWSRPTSMVDWRLGLPTEKVDTPHGPH